MHSPIQTSILLVLCGSLNLVLGSLTPEQITPELQELINGINNATICAKNINVSSGGVDYNVSLLSLHHVQLLGKGPPLTDHRLQK